MNQRARRGTPARRPARQTASPAASPSWSIAKLPVWAGPAIIAICAVGMFAWTWEKWADVIVDFGREAYVPWQLSEGKVLYRDVRHFNGPLSQYVNSIWFRLFGVSLRTLALANAALVGVLLVLLYAILTRIGSRTSALLGCLLFVFAFGFAGYSRIGNYNYICPYSHELTHGILLAVAAVWFVGRYARRGRAIDAAAAGLCTGLALLTKPEVIVATVPAALVGFGASLWLRRDGAQRSLIAVAAFAGVLVVPPLAAFALLSLAMPAVDAWHGTLGGLRYMLRADLTDLPFYRASMGLAEPAQNLAMLLKVSLAWIALFAPAIALGLYWDRRERPQPWLGVAVFAVALVALFALRTNKLWLDNMYYPLPLVLGVVVVALIVLLRRSIAASHLANGNQAAPPDVAARDDLDVPVLRLSFALLALAMLAKMVLHARIHNYGFGLAMPGSVLLVVVLWDWIPAVIAHYGGRGEALRGATLAALVLAATVCVVGTNERLERQTVRVGAGSDRLWADERGTEFNRALDLLARYAPEGGTMSVLPEGILLNYLARREDPTGFASYMPAEGRMFGEDAIQEALVRTRPDVLVRTNTPLHEYGYVWFGPDTEKGRGYLAPVYQWVAANYRLIGAPPPVDGRPLYIFPMLRSDLRATPP